MTDRPKDRLTDPEEVCAWVCADGWMDGWVENGRTNVRGEFAEPGLPLTHSLTHFYLAESECIFIKSVAFW